ncbi:MAG: cobalamin-dependent protein, partial [Anaerolineae bacterium]|nr:cobalamin-dependent protein [Anaerolineae bacterium]
MRISLIGPKWNELVNSYPPLGLGYLAAVAEQEGHEVRIHDMGLRPTTPVAEDMKAVLDFKPDLVAFTSMTTSYLSVEEAATIVKGSLGVPTVIGGPHATSLPDQTIADPRLDFLIYGEGEETWRELLQAMVAQDDRYERIPGLWFKRDGQVVQNAERPLIPNLDSLPFPARHLYELDKYPLYAPDGSPMLTALTSR